MIGVFDRLALELARRVLSLVDSVVVTGSETVQGDGDSSVVMEQPFCNERARVKMDHWFRVLIGKLTAVFVLDFFKLSHSLRCSEE